MFKKPGLVVENDEKQMKSQIEETVREFADAFVNDGYGVDVYGGENPTAAIYLRPETPHEAIVDAAEESGLRAEFDADEGAVYVTQN